MQEPTLTHLEKKTLKILVESTSSKKPLKALDIARMVKLKQFRLKTNWTVGHIIQELREAGFPICQNWKGFYYPQNISEIDEFKRDVGDQIVKLTKVLATLNLFREKNEITEGIDIVSKIFFTIEKYVRTDERTVVKMRFQIDDDGNVIVPAGVRLAD